MKEQYNFGIRGIWHMPASETTKAKDMPCVVLEQTPEGVLYIFTDKPMRPGFNNLTGRTASIMPSDFTPTGEEKHTPECWSNMQDEFDECGRRECMCMCHEF